MNDNDLETFDAINRRLALDDARGAIELLLPLLRRRDPEAIGILGFMYSCGIGRPLSIRRAESLLTLAARRGSGLAAHNLSTVFAVLHHERADAAEREAYWRRRAAELGCDFYTFSRAPSDGREVA